MNSPSELVPLTIEDPEATRMVEHVEELQPLQGLEPVDYVIELDEPEATIELEPLSDESVKRTMRFIGATSIIE